MKLLHVVSSKSHEREMIRFLRSLDLYKHHESYSFYTELNNIPSSTKNSLDCAPEKINRKTLFGKLHNVVKNRLTIKFIETTLKFTFKASGHQKFSNLKNNRFFRKNIKPFLIPFFLIGNNFVWKLNNFFRKGIKSYLKSKLILLYNSFVQLKRRIEAISVINIFRQFYSIYTKKKAFHQQLLKNKYDAVILSEANVEYYSEIYVKAAKKFNIPCFIVPYTLCDPKEPALYYSTQPKNQAGLLRFFPLKKWIYIFNDKRLLRMGISDIIKMYLTNIVPPLPWIQESTSSAYIIAENSVAYNHYLRLGLARDRIINLGNYSHDLIFQALQQKELIKKNLNLDKNFMNDKPLVICSFPPDYTQRSEYKCEYSNYEDLVEAWLNTLKKQHNYNIIINPHPAIQDKTIFYKHMSSNLMISELPIQDLLAVSDIYMACVSATIKWAIALEIPVINYDIYNFDYDDYKNVEGVITVNSKENFITEWSNIVYDSSYRQELINKLKKVSMEWGRIDGKFGERFLKIAENLKIQQNPDFLLNPIL